MGRKNAVKPKTQDELREEAERDAQEKITEATEAANRARAMGGEVGVPAELKETPEDEEGGQPDFDADDPLLKLRAPEGKVYAYMRVDGQEVTLPPFDRQAIEEDGRTIMREYGDGEYRFAVRRAGKHDFTIPWRKFTGFGKGSRAGKESSNGHAGPSATESALVAGLRDDVKELRAQLEKTQEKAEAKAEKAQETILGMFAKMVDAKSNAPAAAQQVDMLDLENKIMDRLDKYGMLRKPGEGGASSPADNRSTLEQIREAKELAAELGLSDTEFDWKREVADAIKATIQHVGPGLGEMLKLRVEQRRAELRTQGAKTAHRPPAQPAAGAPAPSAPPAAPASATAGETTAPPNPGGGEEQAGPEETEPAQPEGEKPVIDLLDLSEWQFKLLKARKFRPDAYLMYFNELVGMARAGGSVEEGSRAVIEKLMAAETLSKADPGSFLEVVADFVSMDDQNISDHLAWAMQGEDVPAEDIEKLLPWLGQLSARLSDDIDEKLEEIAGEDEEEPENEEGKPGEESES